MPTSCKTLAVVANSDVCPFCEADAPPSVNSASCTNSSKSLIQELDQLLGQYYASKHRNDYFDEYGNGKFLSFCREQKIDDEKIQELMQKVNNKQWMPFYLCFWAFFLTQCQNGQFPCFQYTFGELGRRDLQVKNQSHQFVRVFVQIYRLRCIPSDPQLIMTFNADENFKSIRELDQLLGKYYASKGYETYFDGTGRGKFRIWLHDEGRNDDQCDSWFQWNPKVKHDLKTWIFEYFHPNDDFPCFETSRQPVSRELQKRQFAHMFLKLFRLRVVPTNDELRMSFLRENISWWNIAECLKHEMYTAISTKMHEVIEDIKSSKMMAIDDIGGNAVMQFIDLLQSKMTLSNKEVTFIHCAVGRAREFKSDERDSTDTSISSVSNI